jgi:hypothetical protein
MLSACDVYAGRRPTDYKETKWVSADPNIYFEVSESHNTTALTYGEIFANDTITEMYVLFDMGGRAEFTYLPDAKESGSTPRNMIFRGRCKFGKDKLIVDILSNDAGLLADDVTQIKFVREPLE